METELETWREIPDAHGKSSLAEGKKWGKKMGQKKSVWISMMESHTNVLICETFR